MALHKVLLYCLFLLLELKLHILQVLGYNRKEIEKAFDKIDLKDLSLEEMIKQGLKYLSQK